MDETLHDTKGDYYMDVRQFSNGALEFVVRTIRPMHEEAIRAAADPLSWTNFCKENDLPTGRNVTKYHKEQDEEASAYDAKMNHKRAVRRAKQHIRWMVCEMAADRLFTLTYRENVQDREKVKKDFQRFVRLVRKGWKGQEGLSEWKYVAVLERQDRGAFHIHCAVKGWQKVNFLRKAWAKALGGTGDEQGENTLGNIDVTSPKKARWGTQLREWKSAKLASYLTKYLAKTFDEESQERKRYWHSKEVGVPLRERFMLTAKTMVDAILQANEILYFAYGRAINFARSWPVQLNDALWVSLEEPRHA